MKARLWAFYLPQFHPVPENDLWWGKGFTEWTNVSKATPLYKGHQQPKLPGELGYYDLRSSDVREQQADLAREYGVESFCYWHYWFGDGKVLLEKPFQEILKSGKPAMGFCLAWANSTWGGLPYGDGFERILVKQTYPGDEDFKRHFEYVLPAFRDPRYTRVNNKPVFVVYSPTDLPDAARFIDVWRRLATENALPGIHFIAIQHPGWPFQKHGFDAITFASPSHLIRRIKKTLPDKILHRLTGLTLKQAVSKLFKKPERYDYSVIVRSNDYRSIRYDYPFYPCVMPNWDHSPRSGTKAQIFENPEPELFGRMLENAWVAVKDRPEEERIIFIKAWNEWAEGNHLEPDSIYGRRYLEAIRKFLKGN